MSQRTFDSRVITIARSRAAWLTDAYVVSCTSAIFIWLVAWLASFHNIYGWLTDDIYQFQRVMLYERGGQNLIDIQWFHAFDWFIVSIPWLLHWNVPSHLVPQAWNRSGEFRALILYVIFLHAAILAFVAMFLRQLCNNKIVCFGAFVLFMTSPTFMFYADLIDSRYLGLIVGLPALMLLLSRYESIRAPERLTAILVGFTLPGFLIGVGQSIHYTLLYFAGPVALIFWIDALGRKRTASTTYKLAAFVLGLLGWFVPVQLLSLAFHPVQDSMLGTLWQQVHSLASHYDKVSDLASWCHFFIEQMGVPMMAAVLAGAVILGRDTLRPAYISRFHARLMLWATAIATLYLVVTPAVAFYRQVCVYQIFYGLFAMVAVDALTRKVGSSLAVRRAVAGTLFVAVAFVPTIVRMPEVFVAAQGLGRAINLAHEVAGEQHVYFIEFYDFDLHPQAILSQHDFAKLQPNDVIVTDFPTLFNAKYPDLFALMHDARPLAAFPTEWCTNENWVEERTYWDFRRYNVEPESCNAAVYRVSDILRARRGRPLDVRAVRADSSLGAMQPAARVLATRQTATPLDYSIPCCSHFPFMNDVWASQPSAGPHWVEMSFAVPARIDAITIVPANYFAPPGFSEVGRPDTLQIYGSASPRAALQLLWTGSMLRDAAIYTARFTPATVSVLRFVMAQAPPDSLHHALMIDQRIPSSRTAALGYIRFPGYVASLRSVSAPR